MEELKSLDPIKGGRLRATFKCPGAMIIRSGFSVKEGIANIENTGSCPVEIESLDENYTTINLKTSVTLRPGEKLPLYMPPPGTVYVVANCGICAGNGVLELDQILFA